MMRMPKLIPFKRSIAAAMLALCSGLGTVSASNTGSVVEISQPARGQSNAGIPRPNSRDSVLSGGLLNGLPASAVNFDRCLQDDTQLGCANYCTANPSMCGTTSPGSGNGGSGRREQLVVTASQKRRGNPGTGVGMGFSENWFMGFPEVTDPNAKVYVDRIVLTSGCGFPVMEDATYAFMPEYTHFPLESQWYEGMHMVFWGTRNPDCGFGWGATDGEYLIYATVVYP